MTAASLTDQVTSQLADELGQMVHAVAVLAGPDATIEWEQTIRARCGLLAAQLVQDQDDRLAAETVIDVMGVLWPHCTPEQAGRADWWRTPLGQMCARSLGTEDAEAVTHSVAAAMLGCQRQHVSILLRRGQLDRHPDGGVVRASVLQRIAHDGDGGED